MIAEYEGTPAEAVEVPDLSALRQLYSEKNPAVPSLRYMAFRDRTLGEGGSLAFQKKVVEEVFAEW